MNIQDFNPILSPSSGARHQGNVDMINDFLERELDDWMKTSSSSSSEPDFIQLGFTNNKVHPSFISYEDNFTEPYPLFFKEENGRSTDLKLFLDFSSWAERAHDVTVEDESSSDNDLEQSKPKEAEDEESSDADFPKENIKVTMKSELERDEDDGKPSEKDENPRLGRWVKRQRYQYKLLQQGKQSTLTESRIQSLEEVGFVWDSHAALWVERLNELKAFHKVHGHCNVPSTYPENVQLSTWVKCQRRQYKLYTSDKRISHLTADRIAALDKLGFEWDGRVVRSKKTATSTAIHCHHI